MYWLQDSENKKIKKWADPERVVSRQAADGVIRVNIQENVLNRVKNALIINIWKNQKNEVLKQGNLSIL